MSNAVFVVVHLFQQSQGVDLGHDLLTGFNRRHAAVVQGVLVHEAVETDDSHARKVVSLADLEVCGVMAGSDLEGARAEIQQDSFVRDHRYCPVGDGDDDLFADDIRVAWVSRVDSDGCIPEDGLRARGGDRDGP